MINRRKIYQYFEKNKDSFINCQFREICLYSPYAYKECQCLNDAMIDLAEMNNGQLNVDQENMITSVFYDVKNMFGKE